MATYAGEAIAIIAAATDPQHGTLISDATAQVEFYAPGKNPAKVAADRESDQGPFPMTYDATVANKDGSAGAYVAFVDTTGWQPGKWAFKVTLTGSYQSWDYGSIKLDA